MLRRPFALFSETIFHWYTPTPPTVTQHAAYILPRFTVCNVHIAFSSQAGCCGWKYLPITTFPVLFMNKVNNDSARFANSHPSWKAPVWSISSVDSTSLILYHGFLWFCTAIGEDKPNDSIFAILHCMLGCFRQFGNTVFSLRYFSQCIVGYWVSKLYLVAPSRRFKLKGWSV